MSEQQLEWRAQYLECVRHVVWMWIPTRATLGSLAIELMAVADRCSSLAQETEWHNEAVRLIRDIYLTPDRTHEDILRALRVRIERCQEALCETRNRERQAK